MPRSWISRSLATVIPVPKYPHSSSLLGPASIPLIDDVLVESGTNMSLGCPGMTQNTFVVHIEWTCTGRCGSPSNLPSDTTHTLLKYVKDQGTSVFKNKDRVRLDQGLFSLEFDPVSSLDRGSYSCLINNRPNPDAVIRLNVLAGKVIHGGRYLV
ncbi:hypothetical protein TCAL_15008 [Tigriopus californicus]|uniref:Ig-like domain-containing protein n=1 Tax=Tigriopus californicus TaxID=6832 RepID=A0A553NXH2_TIGCA|nr:hypothetical protein TCAL_15008 [Tigriopus californicus]